MTTHMDDNMHTPQADDAAIRDLFAAFNPPLSSDSRFMDSLGRKLETLDSVRAETALQKRRSRRALAIAAMAGFIAGFICALLLPYVTAAIGSLATHLLPTALPGTLSSNISVWISTLSWLTAGLISVFIALSAYDLTLSISAGRQRQA